MGEEIRIDVARVEGLAAQLIEPICEQIDGCLRVESGLNSYTFVFAAEVAAIEAWQRVHSALLLVDPDGERLTLPDHSPPPAPEPGLIPDPTRVGAELPLRAPG